MSKYEQRISPIKMSNSRLKSFGTPVEYLSHKNNTIYEQEYYKQKCERLQRQNKDLKQHVRIVETQNKELKTQIQFYRERPQTLDRSFYSRVSYQQKDTSPVSFKDEKIGFNEQTKQQELERLIKQIRVLKNNHQFQINQNKNQQKRLNKKILQLQDLIHKNDFQSKQKLQNAGKIIQEKNISLEKQLKQLRKSVVVYMEQREQNERMIQNLRKQVDLKNQQISEISKRQKMLLQEKSSLEKTIVNLNFQKQKIEFQNDINSKVEQSNQPADKNLQESSNIRQSLYDNGKSPSKRDRIRQSNFSIQTFNGNCHVPAQEAFEVSESLRNQIYRLQNQLQSQSIQHQKDIDDLKLTLEKYQKQIKQKEKDLLNLLTKVKPLMLEKHKLTSKQNISPQSDQKVSFQVTKQTIGKNSFGLKMLDLYLKKYKIEPL